MDDSRTLRSDPSVTAEPRFGEAVGDEPPAARRRFALWLTVAFALLTVPRLLAHELWRDEAWLWLVVTESGSLGDLRRALERSGQGYLFPLLCYAARQLWSSWRAMQLLNLMIAGAAAFVFARWAPLRRWARVLCVLGYFSFYEYAVFSRHYATGMLLLWLACAAARSRRPALGMGVALGLLCMTTVYGYVLAAAVAVGWLIGRRAGEDRGEEVPRARGEAAAGLALFLAGAAAGFVQLVPAAGTSFAPGWQVDWQPALAARVAQVPWRSFVPLPRPGLHFWNSNLLDGWPMAGAIAGSAVLALAFALLPRRRAALFTFAAGAAGLALFAYVKYVGVLRHHGHWWLLFLAALWLGGGPQANRREGRWEWRSAVFAALLAVHAAAAAYASWMDLRHPFSNAARAAQRLRALGLDQHLLLGYREPPAAPVALALGKPLYAPSRRLFTTHPDWGPEQRDLGPEELRCAARDLAQRERRDVALVINQPLPPWPEVEAVESIVGAINASEDYYLYRLVHDRLPATAGEASCGAVPP